MSQDRSGHVLLLHHNLSSFSLDSHLNCPRIQPCTMILYISFDIFGYCKMKQSHKSDPTFFFLLHILFLFFSFFTQFSAPLSLFPLLSFRRPVLDSPVFLPVPVSPFMFFSSCNIVFLCSCPSVLGYLFSMPSSVSVPHSLFPFSVSLLGYCSAIFILLFFHHFNIDHFRE